MNKKINTIFFAFLLVTCSAFISFAQSTTANISGQVMDEQQKVIPNATVKAREIATNTARTITSDGEGRYRFPNLSIGNYELTVEASGFAKLIRTGITLLVNQDAVIDVTLKISTVNEVVTISENASILNTTNSEVSTRFDEKRLSELPISTNRNVFNVVLSAPGVSQLGSGQTGFAAGVNFSSNGGRVRSNNFIIDGQDSNDPSVSGGQQALNNPDLVQELRLITNQFAPEYGRNSGSVVSVVTKTGTNQFHGSAFWFHNDNHQNSCSNTDKAGKPGGYCNPAATRSVLKGSPFRLENQIGGSIGGPVIFPRFGIGGKSIYNGADRTWFFATVQKWTDRQLGSGSTLNGAPTEAGRQILQAAAGTRPQVAALLKFLPAAQTPINKNAVFTIGAQSYTVPLGALTGSTSFKYDDWQWSSRIDHQLNENNRFHARYLYDSSLTSGSGQATPFGLTTKSPSRTQSLLLNLNSVLSQRLVNEVRASYQRFGSVTTASDTTSQEIPSIEISELGLTGFNAAASRTAIGLAVNLPQFRYNNTYQFQDTLSYSSGNHSMKFGVDIQHRDVKSFFLPTIRGRLAYSTLQRYVNDVADTATINKALPGGSELQYYKFNDLYFFAQDEWKIRPGFSITYGLRYELPNNSVANLVPFNDKILAAAGGNPAYKFTPVPKSDRNNLQPRIGFNWKINGLGFLSGQDKTVLRGGYARTNDSSFINLNLNVASAFPFVGAITLPGTVQTDNTNGVSSAYTRLAAATISGDPNQFTRTIVGSDFKAPNYDQFSLELSRELSKDVSVKAGYVGTRGTALFQTLDGNPRKIGCSPTATDNCRVDPTRGVIRLRANSASSTYHSLQVSLDKRLSKGFTTGVHYTWSSFIDTASEVFNPSSGEVAVAQDSFNLRNDRGRSAYDRPHRFTGNIVYELPIMREQKGALGRVVGGWQINTFFTLQSGAPFTPLNGVDPTGALSGIDGLVGNAIRPNIYTSENLSKLNVEQLYLLDQKLRAQAVTEAQRIFATLTNPPVGALGTALPSTLLTLSQGRVVANAAGVKSVVVDFVGLPAGVRTGNAGRNILRADGIGDVGFGLLKNIRVREGNLMQFRADMFNATNTRNFGIPEGRVNSANFLNQWGTDGGKRRIILGLRYTF